MKLFYYIVLECYFFEKVLENKINSNFYKMFIIILIKRNVLVFNLLLYVSLIIKMNWKKLIFRLFEMFN